ncbi:MAG: HAMP domain-containing sensor histidine kinase [Flavihumibacter sp.]
MTIRTKITLLFTLLVAILLLLTSFSVYYFSSLQRRANFETRLFSRSHNVAQLYKLLGENNRLLMTKIDSSNVPFYTNKSVHIYTTGNKLLYTFNNQPSDDFQLTDEQLKRIIDNGELAFKLDNRDAFGQYETDAPIPFVVVVAATDTEGRIWLHDLRKILIGSWLAGTLLSMVTGILFSRQLVRPISAIIEEVQNISTRNLSQRIDAGSGQDELFRLANTFNDLLNRMQESFLTQRRFISNASHELSSPLSSISSQLEVTLQKQRSENEYRAVLMSVQEDVQQMRQLTRSLLEMAKTGHTGNIELDEIRLDEVLLKTVAAVKKLSAEYQVVVQFDDFPDDEKDFMVFGNADLLFSAFSNVIENGCKYSADHTSRVLLRFRNPWIQIDVVNEGNPIEKEEAEAIFQPFYRAAKTSQEKGFGLGLALARRIIGMHKGQINILVTNNETTTFRIELPVLHHFRA